MKNILPLLFGAALLPLAVHATSTSNVVGYITHDITGNSAGNGGPWVAGADTYVGATLTQPVEYAAQATASPSGGSTVALPSGTPTTYDSTYVLEITDGPSEGFWSTVVSSTDTSITVQDTFPAGLAADVGIGVRKHTTLGDLLGANEAGLVGFDGAVQNDEVQILRPADPGQPVDTIAWVEPPVITPAGWYDLVLGTEQSGRVLEPGTSVKIKRFAAADTSFVSVGEVKETATQIDIFQGTTWIGTTLAVGATLNDMTFPTSLNQFDGVSPNDELQEVQPDQSTTAYVALPGGVFGPDPTMGDLAGGTDVGGELFPQGTGRIIIRPAPLADGVMTYPGTTVAP